MCSLKAVWKSFRCCYRPKSAPMSLCKCGTLTLIKCGSQMKLYARLLTSFVESTGTWHGAEVLCFDIRRKDSVRIEDSTDAKQLPGITSTGADGVGHVFTQPDFDSGVVERRNWEPYSFNVSSKAGTVQAQLVAEVGANAAGGLNKYGSEAVFGPHMRFCGELLC